MHHTVVFAYLHFWISTSFHFDGLRSAAAFKWRNWMPLKELHLNLLKNGTVACFDFDAETSDREVLEDERFHRTKGLL